MPLCFLAPHHVLLGGGTGGASLDPCGPASSQDRPMDTLPNESGGIWRSLRGSVQAGRLYRGPPGPGCALTPPAYLHCLPSRQPGLWATGSATQSAQGDHRHPAGPGLWPQPVTLLPSEPPPQTSRTPRTAFPWLPGSAWEQGEARLGWIASRHPHRGCCCSLLPGTLVTSCPHTDNAGGGGPRSGSGHLVVDRRRPAVSWGGCGTGTRELGTSIPSLAPPTHQPKEHQYAQGRQPHSHL